MVSVKYIIALIVAIDSHGNSLYRRIQEQVAAKINAFRLDD